MVFYSTVSSFSVLFRIRGPGAEYPPPGNPCSPAEYAENPAEGPAEYAWRAPENPARVAPSVPAWGAHPQKVLAAGGVPHRLAIGKPQAEP